MNSYGDPGSARGRAQVPGPGGGYDYDQAEGAGGRDPYAPSSARASAGPPPGGGAPFGVAAVRPVVGSAPVGSAPVGRATVGRANVPGGGPQYDDEPGGDRSVGRATVPGRLRPGSPAGPRGYHGPPGTPGGGQNGRTGPDRAGDGSGGLAGAAARLKGRISNRRLNWMIAAFAVVIMVAGGVVVGGTYYYDNVPRPEKLDLPETSTIFFKDNTQLAKIGEANRSLVPIERIPDHVKKAVVAAEDKHFYEHGGIDVQGIVRAAWNNVTGGSKQGASTITQQYARHAAELTGITYARKVREAVMAKKLEQEYEKEEILGFYLNTIYFGRGAYGIEAAAQAFFGKSVLEPPASPRAVTVAEAAVLAAVIRQPVPDTNSGHQGFDPHFNLPEAKGRWDYVLTNMVEMGWLDPGKRAAAQYPKVAKFDDKSCVSTNECGVNTPVGNVVNYVKEELKAMGITNWKEGGYRITTSIDRRAQAAAEAAARRAVKGSELDGQPPNLMAALVAIDPATGRVLAYYGGDSGVGIDYAGTNWVGGKLVGGHSPGSSFKIYTLAAALRENYSISSYWDVAKVEDGPFKISNAGRTASCDGKPACTLEDSTIQSYNVPFYWITKAIGPDKVVAAARDAGVRMMWTDSNELVELSKVKDARQVAPAKFSTQVGYGQYAVTVLDHANGVATLANRGVYNRAHFVTKVERKDAETGKWVPAGSEKVRGQRVFDTNKVDDEVSVLARISTGGAKGLSGGRPAAAKTGTWELNSKSSDNGDAWTVGFTPQIATAVWVGNVNKRQALKYYPEGSRTLAKVQGSNLPGLIWRRFMNEAHKSLPVKDFADRKNTGDPDISVGVPGAAPSPDKKQDQCLIPLILCPSPGGGGHGGDPGGGGDPLPSDRPTKPA
ncbi:MAG TPA: transglycosylase domain-containing protein [Micromonosporaceae bacterium]|nr:transglycosylase domain-containing protein [Micromonosporaceae bacterium]